MSRLINKKQLIISILIITLILVDIFQGSIQKNERNLKINKDTELLKDYSSELKIATWNWTTPTVISSESINDSRRPSITIDSSGNIYIAWTDKTNYSNCGFDPDIFSKFWNASTNTWSTIDVITNETFDWSINPSIEVDNIGNLHLTWTDNADYNGSGTDNDVYYLYKNATTGNWSNVEVVSIDCDDTSYGPNIAIDNNRNVHIVWSDKSNYNGAGTDYDIFYKLRNATTGKWIPTKVLSEGSTGWAYAADIACDSSGNVHIVFHDDYDYGGAGSDNDIIYRCWNKTLDSWSMIEVISTESSDDSYNPSIALDRNDNPHVAWRDRTNYKGAGSTPDIFYKCWNASSNNWTLTEVISTESTDICNYPSIALDHLGNIYIAWEDTTDLYGSGTDIDICYKRWNATTEVWTTTEIVSTESTSDAEMPKIILDHLNNSCIVWFDTTDYSSSGIDQDIFFKKTSPDYIPYSNHPSDIETTMRDTDKINWVLYDDFGGGMYRVWANDTNDDYYLIVDWTIWSNSSNLGVWIDRKAIGLFNYTIEYFDKNNLWGTPDTVIVSILEIEKNGKSPNGGTEPSQPPILIILLLLIGITSSVVAFGSIFVKNYKSKLKEREKEVEELKKQREEITEDDITISKEKRICLVHKGPVEGHNFVCPNCRAFYCLNCIVAIKEIENQCWSCGTPIDPSKAVKILKRREDEIDISREGPKSMK